jgi:hypothetical protein
MTHLQNRIATQTSNFYPNPGLTLTGQLDESNGCIDEAFHKGQIHDAQSPWIGVDLDGTLASDTGRVIWDEQGQPKIGHPIDEMVLRVGKWIASGFTVKIFTARASSPLQVAAIRAWLSRRGLPDLEVTNVKDLNMISLWDDRCVQVIPNTGRPVDPKRKKLGRATRRAPRFPQKNSSGLLSYLKIFLTF